MLLPRGYRNEAAKEPKAFPAKGFLRMASVISVRFVSETYGIRMNLLNKVHFCILSSRKSIVAKDTLIKSAKLRGCEGCAGKE